MKIDLRKTALPPVFARNGRPCYLDPVRKKLIYVTPEETVRQRIISWLTNTQRVPDNMIASEDALSHYGLKTKDRADIVILAATPDDELAPLAVIECKANGVPLDEKAFAQAQRYSDALGCTYTLLTNGTDSFGFRYDEDTATYVRIEEFPAYKEMLAGGYSQAEEASPPPRIPFHDLKKELLYEMEDAKRNGYLGDISPYTPLDLALPLFNLLEGLLDVRVKMPAGNYGMFRLIEDYGVRMLKYGNGGGGTFFGPYRSFLVDVNGSTEFYSISVSSYRKTGKDKEAETCINVAHDYDDTAHLALQLVAEDNMSADGNTIHFYHYGRIAIGRAGSGRKDELMELVKEEMPEIIRGNRYYLGSVTNDHLLRLDEPDVIRLVVSLISYSIIRDEYRKMVKKRTGK